MDLSNQTFNRVDFSGQDLQGVNMSHSKFSGCNFNKANLSGNDCSYSKFNGSLMIGTKCRNTNFAHSTLGCAFRPSDAFGVTLTFRCETFRGMVTSALWWYCWVYFALLMIPDKDSDGVNPKDALIASIGLQKYLRLKRMFIERELLILMAFSLLAGTLC
jgi:uncharacterized protein YjbI with pentapeptide repeats